MACFDRRDTVRTVTFFGGPSSVGPSLVVSAFPGLQGRTSAVQAFVVQAPAVQASVVQASFLAQGMESSVPSVGPC